MENSCPRDVVPRQLQEKHNTIYFCLIPIINETPWLTHMHTLNNNTLISWTEKNKRGNTHGCGQTPPSRVLTLHAVLLHYGDMASADHEKDAQGEPPELSKKLPSAVSQDMGPGDAALARNPYGVGARVSSLSGETCVPVLCALPMQA